MSFGRAQELEIDRDLSLSNSQVVAPFLANANNGTVHFRYSTNIN